MSAALRDCRGCQECDGWLVTDSFKQLYVSGGLDDGPSERLRAAGYSSGTKAHVFVAMPFRDDMDDVFHYGIQSAVKSAGFLCERADLASFTGDVLDWVRSRIRSPHS